MKLFLDTNVIIDVIASREPFVEDSRKVLSLCEEGKAEGVMSALTLCTISYVLRKYAAPGTLRRQIRDLRNLLPPVDLTTQLLDRAISSTITDFEAQGGRGAGGFGDSRLGSASLSSYYGRVSHEEYRSL